MNNSYFIKDLNKFTKTSTTFIKLGVIDIVVDGFQNHSQSPIKLLIDNNNLVNYNYCYSSVGLSQDGKVFAHLYNNFEYTKAIKKLLEDINNINNFRLHLYPNNIDYNQCNIELSIFISKDFLFNLYKYTTTPLLVYKLLISLKRNNSLILKNTTSFPTSITGTFRIKPFYYQQENFNWMKHIEQLVDKKSLCYQNFCCSKIPNKYNRYYRISKVYLPEIDDNLIMNDYTKQIEDYKDFPVCNFNFYGGVLADEIGLGKTFSMIALIKLQNNMHSPSLIICPKRICLQWKTEVNKTTDLNCTIIYNITQFNKLNFDNINQYDIIIIPYNFLINKKYLENTINSDKFSITNFQWERVILDEGHEYINTSKTLNRQNYRNIREQLFNLKSKYRWICSGTPFSNKYDFWDIIFFLSKINIKYVSDLENSGILQEYLIKYREPILVSNDMNNWHLLNNRRINNRILLIDNKYLVNNIVPSDWKYIYYKKNLFNTVNLQKKLYTEVDNDLSHSYNHILQLLFRHSNKERIEKQLCIPKPIIKTDILEMTKMEMSIYSSAIDDPIQQFQFCNHIQISEQYSSLLGSTIISPNDINNKMVKFYNNKIKRNQNSLTKLNSKINNENHNEEQLTTIRNNISVLNSELISDKYRLNIFNDLTKALKDANNCPVCLEDFNTIIKAVTKCGHFICDKCIKKMNNLTIKCPICNCFNNIKKDIKIIETTNKSNNKLGTKINYLIKNIQSILTDNSTNRIIIFSQWENMLKLLANTFNVYNINNIILNGNYHVINKKLRQFKLDDDFRVILLSAEKAASGLNLIETSHIFLIDTLNTDPNYCKTIESQAIGRSVRIGQTKTVCITRLIMKNTIEHTFYNKYQKNYYHLDIKNCIEKVLNNKGLSFSIINKIIPFIY